MKQSPAVWCLFILTLLLVAAAPVCALDLSGTGLVASAAFLPEVDDEVVVLLANTGPQPLRVEFRVVRADDFSVIDESGPFMVPSGKGVQHVSIPSQFPVLVMARYRAPVTTSARLSLQVRNPAGETRIFTDGFESGDLSAW